MKLFLTIATIILLSACAAQNNKVSSSAKSKIVKPCTDSKSPTCRKSPCTNGPKDPIKKGQRRMWASSWIGYKAPNFQIQKWLNNKPASIKDKFILIEFWNTWCPPCRESLKMLNRFHNKFSDNLVVIGICDESENAIKKFLKDKPKRKIDFYCGIDQKARMKKEINVWGVPHAILIEPENGIIIWEGFPLLEGFELKDEIIQNAINIYKKSKSRK